MSKKSKEKKCSGYVQSYIDFLEIAQKNSYKLLMILEALLLILMVESSELNGMSTIYFGFWEQGSLINNKLKKCGRSSSSGELITILITLL